MAYGLVDDIDELSSEFVSDPLFWDEVCDSLVDSDSHFAEICGDILVCFPPLGKSRKFWIHMFNDGWDQWPIDNQQVPRIHSRGACTQHGF